jgi:hypothetical protein
MLFEKIIFHIILILYCSISDSDSASLNPDPDPGFVLIPDPDVCPKDQKCEKKTLVDKKCNVKKVF